MKKFACCATFILPLTGFASAAEQGQSVHRASTPVVTTDGVASETVPPASLPNSAFGAAIEAALAETKPGSVRQIADPSGRFVLQIDASAAQRTLNLANTERAQMQSWTLAGDAPREVIDATIAQIAMAAGHPMPDAKAGVGPLRDLGK